MPHTRGSSRSSRDTPLTATQWMRELIMVRASSAAVVLRSNVTIPRCMTRRTNRVGPSVAGLVAVGPISFRRATPISVPFSLIVVSEPR
jgi:hypothetical protein